MKLYICEKPSQAADIARELGNARRTENYWDTTGGRVTWCVGHLLGLLMPEDYDEAKYGSPWRWEVLPIVPRPFRMAPARNTAGQLRAIGKLLKECSSVVVATDSDREGEMIAWEILDYFKYSGRVERFLVSALDPESIRKAITQLRDGKERVNYYHAARARSQADWLVGMTGTRALTLKSPRGSGTVSVGRVQTPTVALVVRRDREIAKFKSQDYYELAASVRSGSEVVELRYAPKVEERLLDRRKADDLARLAVGLSGPLGVKLEKKSQVPPKLLSLSGLQKRADVLWGWAAKKTLGVAQSLYETHKATTYPRTDCEYLPEEQLADVPVITGNLLSLPEFRHLKSEKLSPRKSVFNTAKISAHHAIIPTKVQVNVKAMSDDEQKGYLLICAHYLASLLPDYQYDATTLTLEAVAVEFRATGAVPTVLGWKVAMNGAEAEEVDAGNGRLPLIPHGTLSKIEDCKVESKKTKPPARYTEGTLLSDMENVAKFVEDVAKKDRLNSEENNKQRGIGTSATRAEVIANIRHKEFVIPFKGKQLQASPKAHALIELLEKELPALADPGETAVWEEQLEAIAEGRKTAEAFVDEVVGRICEYLQILSKRPTESALPSPAAKPTGVIIPAPKEGDVELLERADGHYEAPGWPGKFFAEIAKRRMAPGDYRLLVLDWKGSREGVRFEGFVSLKGSKFATKLRFNGDARPYPKVEMVFQD